MELGERRGGCSGDSSRNACLVRLIQLTWDTLLQRSAHIEEQADSHRNGYARATQDFAWPGRTGMEVIILAV